MNTFWIDGPEGELAVEAVGWTGTPLLLLHGLGGNASHWNALSRGLRPHRVLTLDLRGHGRTKTRPGAPMDPASPAKDVVATAEANQLDRFILGAHSFGAAVAIETAALVPDRIAGLFLVEPARDLHALPESELAPYEHAVRTNVRATVTESWLSRAGNDPKLRDRLLKELAATPDDVLRDALLAVTRWNSDPARARFQGPILTLTTEDAAFREAGHWLHVTQPDAVRTALEAWPPFLETAATH